MKIQVEHDYGARAGTLVFDRTYAGSATVGHMVTLGIGWVHTYQRRLALTTSNAGGTVHVYRKDGRALRFDFSSSGITPDPDISDRLIELKDAGGTRTGWRYLVATTEEEEAYDAAGKLISIATRAGLTTTLAYDAQSRLTTVTDPYGRTLVFTYDTHNRLVTMTDPDGGVYTYSYDMHSNLTAVTSPDSQTRSYHYENTDFPHALTGITDENGERFATYAYDTQGRTISSEHAGGVEKTTLTYDTNNLTSTVTDALNTTRTYNFAVSHGVMKTGSISQPCTTCGTSSAAMTYDVNGNVASRTDFNGNKTTYTYDLMRNLEAQRIEAIGTPQARTMTMEWHPTFRLMTRMSEPLRITTYTYDEDGTTCGARGAMCSRTIQATTDTTGAQGFNAAPVGNSRTMTYTYNSNGQPLTVDGARTDVQDLMSYAYDTQGNMTSLTNALGHVTTITAYNAHGQPLTIVDPNGLVTTLTYDARLRLTSRTVGTETTSYTYDGVGQLTKVTLPDGSFLTYSYDAAHRLTGMQDSVGDTITYTLDAMGNRIKEEIFDPSNALTQTRSRVFDSLNRLAQDIGAQQQTTQYVYDNQGNRTSITDPLNHTTSNAYDALNRLVQMTDPNNGKTSYGYDGLDQLTQVSDPRNLVTQYTYSGLNDLTKTISPDTGTTQNTFDDAGNVITSTDAKGQTTRYTYDALNRVTHIAFAGGATHAYQYDQGQNGLGRLTSITDPSGTTNYAYDLQGRVLTETRVIAGKSYTTRYRYNAAGQMIEMTYPAGRVLAYTYDQANRIASLTLDGKPLLANIAYQPFGAVAGWTFANGAQYERPYDLDARVDSYILRTDTRTLIYDDASRIVGFDHSDPTRDQTFDYDALDRLTHFITPSTTQSYVYDAVGNRTSQTIGASQTTYQLSSISNQLTSVSGITPKTYSYDANGSVTSDGTNTFTFDARGRMIQATTPAGATQYGINALGQRVKKTTGSSTTVFHYDTAGHLIAESDAQGNAQRDYVYLLDMPVAVLATSASAPVIRPQDFNGDGCIDRKDATVVMSALNKPASGANDPRDLDHDGKITVLDARKLALMCDRPGCKACTMPVTSTSTSSPALYYLYTDHLNTVRVITDTSNKVVWRWDSSDPFGVASPNEDPDSDGKALTFNLRFPGQYFDKETGLYYNYFRDYEPGTGRYVQSDPIGLDGGLNTYSYAQNNLLQIIDSDGLASTKIGGNKITVHKNDVDKWPSDPHGHIYDKNQVVDTDGSIYNKNSGQKVDQLSNKQKELWKKFLEKIGKGVKCINPILIIPELLQRMCEADPTSGACIPIPDPDDPCKGGALCS